MKKNVYLIVILLAITSCKKNNVYSELLKQERELIESFIMRQGIEVVTEEPTVWKENTYWKVPDSDNFYFHLVSPGDTSFNEVETGDKISIRFKRYTLTEYADTLYYWTTDDNPKPIKFDYNPLYATSDQTCLGWQLAVKYMKYPKAECKIICPSKLGFSEENSSVTPYGYDIKRTDLQIK